MTTINDSSAEQFALRWNNYSNNLTMGFSSYFNSKDLVDVTLAVEGQLVQAHKLILSICSSYFQDIFKNNPCQHPVVILKDIKYAEIDALLKFMYQGEVNVKQEELDSFLKVAATLKVKGLTLENNINNDSSNNINNESSQQYYNRSYKNEEALDSKDTSKLEKSPKKRRRDNTSSKCMKKTKNSSLITTDSTDHDSSSKMVLKVEAENDDLGKENTVYTNEDLNTAGEYVNAEAKDDKSIDLTKDDDFSDNDEVLPSNQFNKMLELLPNTESVVTYRLSTRGRPQLIHEGYVYNLTSRSEVLNRSHYRCAEQHRGCRGKCAVIAEQFMPTGIYDHNHDPSYQSEKDYKEKKVNRN